jgi:V/A-type H+-transporting ATPase subunit D
MSESANRSRLFELRRDVVAARRSAELLERKREVLLHEIAHHTAEIVKLRAALAPRYEAAHETLRIARVEAGRHAIAAAAIAQDARCSLRTRAEGVMGVSLLRLSVAVEPFHAFYGTAGTTASVDDAAIAFREITADILRLAERELAVTRLEIAARKTGRLLNALDKIIVPRIEQEIRTIVDGLEEEERDEAARGRIRRRRPAMNISL